MAPGRAMEMDLAFLGLNFFRAVSRSERKIFESGLVFRRLVFSFRPWFEKLAIKVFVPPTSIHKYIL